MAAFGSFALLIALALAAYNLFAGAVALRLIATGQPAADFPGASGRHRPPRRHRRLFRRLRAAAFALIWSVFTNDFSITYILEHSNRALPGALQVRGAVERPGRLAAAVGVAAGGLRLCAAPHAQDRRQALRLRRHDPRRRPGLLPAVLDFAAPPFRARYAGRRFPPTATASIPCSSIRRW